MKRLQVVVDRDLCDAHGVCVSRAPEVFEIGDDDLMKPLAEFPGEGQIDAVREAIRGCPKGALALVEVE